MSSPHLIYAENFGIVLDQTCLTMIKNNVSSNCPTYEDILALFPDTSNKQVSGDFGYYNGIYQRMPSKMQDSYQYYRFSTDTIIFVDPPPQTRQKIKTVEIMANLNEYALSGAYNPTTHSITTGIDRYVKKCFNAYINADLWHSLTGDTLNHLKSSCSKDSTRFNDTITKDLRKSVFDISTSYKWKLEQWQKQMINKCGSKVCLYEKENPTPPH